MNYAVIQTGGKQYKVEKGTTLVVDKLADLKEGANTTFSEVLLVVDEGRATLGKPFVAGATVTAKVISEDFKGEKVRVSKFLAKSRYRKVMGHRSRLSKVEVLEIGQATKAEKKSK